MNNDDRLFVGLMAVILISFIWVFAAEERKHAQQLADKGICVNRWGFERC